jgi:hypothetical protein
MRKAASPSVPSSMAPRRSVPHLDARALVDAAPVLLQRGRQPLGIPKRVERRGAARQARGAGMGAAGAARRARAGRGLRAAGCGGGGGEASDAAGPEFLGERRKRVGAAGGIGTDAARWPAVATGLVVGWLGPDERIGPAGGSAAAHARAKQCGDGFLPGGHGNCTPQKQRPAPQYQPTERAGPPRHNGTPARVTSPSASAAAMLLAPPLSSAAQPAASASRQAMPSSRTVF